MLALNPISIALVAAGGALGAVARYGAVQLAVYVHPAPFPWGTLLVNILGSFAIGVLMARYTAMDSESSRLFLVTGLLGGFTTFSAFSFDALQLMQRGQIASAGAYVMGSVFLSLLAVAVGFALVRG